MAALTELCLGQVGAQVFLLWLDLAAVSAQVSLFLNWKILDEKHSPLLASSGSGCGNGLL